MRLSTPALVVLFLPLAAWPFSPNEPPVERDSPAIRAVLQEPVTSDVFPLFVALSKLSIAGDHDAVKAMEAYITAVGIARITGIPAPARATVGDVIKSPITTESTAAAIEQILKGNLRAESPKIQDTNVLVSIRNTGKLRVNQFDANLMVTLPQREPVSFRCNEPRYTVTPIGPGEAVLHECRPGTSRITEAELAAAVADPSALTLEVPRISFADPNLSLTSRGAVWFDTNDVPGPAAAHTKARAELAALPCGDRNACGEDFKRTLEQHPFLLVGGVFGGAGVLLGSLVALVTRRRWWWGLGLVGALTIATAAVVVWLLMANNLLGVLLLIAGPVACIAFLAGMVPALALIRRKR